MHKIFVTAGVVLGKRGVGEANTLVVMLTEHLGLVRARAQSARLQKSKLRYGLEPLTRARFSLVRGKHEWRLVGAEAASREYIALSATRRQRSGKVARLLLRLISGEEPVPEVYKTVAEGFAYLARAESEQDAEAVECVLVLRILAALGYLPQTQEIKKFVETDFFSLELAAEAARSRALLIRAINESLESTGL